MRKLLLNLAVAVVTFFIGVAVTSPVIFHHSNPTAVYKFKLLRANAQEDGSGRWLYQSSDGEEVSYSRSKQSFRSFRSSEFVGSWIISADQAMTDSLDELKPYGGDIFETESATYAEGMPGGRRAIWELQWLNRSATRILWTDENGFHKIDCDSRKWALEFEDALRNDRLPRF